MTTLYAGFYGFLLQNTLRTSVNTRATYGTDIIEKNKNKRVN